MRRTALLILNGELPAELPETNGFDLVVCTDGSFLQLLRRGFDISVLSFVCGDFDSVAPEVLSRYLPAEKILVTPDQDYNDFQKALDILIAKGVSAVTVVGGGGGEMDHFLANLTVAYRSRTRVSLVFLDEHSRYFFIDQSEILSGVKGKMISLQPFPCAENIYTDGLHWEWQGGGLDIRNNSGTRNFAEKDTVKIELGAGTLLVFISHKPYIKPEQH